MSCLPREAMLLVVPRDIPLVIINAFSKVVRRDIPLGINNAFGKVVPFMILNATFPGAV